MTHSEEIMVANMDTKEREFVNNLMCENSRLEERITELETITEEKVERVARRVYRSFPETSIRRFGFPQMVDCIGEDIPFEEAELKREYLGIAKAALEAAIGGGDE